MPRSLLAGIERQIAGDANGAAQLYRSALPDARWALGHQTPDGAWVCGPDFLVIGAARCGTSWLKKRLCGVSAVRILAAEPNYFSYRWSSDPREYVATFASDAVKNASLAHDGSRRLYGEKSPSYLLMSHTKINLMMSLFPAVKIICMLRDPVERGWSDIRRRTDDMDAIPDLPLILKIGHFAEHLARWAHHVAPSNLHLIDYQDVCAQPEKVFGETLDFLGLDRDKAAAHFPPAPVSTPAMPEAVRAMLQAEYAGESWTAAEMRALTNRVWEEQRIARKLKVIKAKAAQAAALQAEMAPGLERQALA